MGAKINKTYLWFICIVAALGGLLLFGYDTAVISGTIGLLRNQFNLSTGLEGTLVSAVLFGSIIGCLIAGYLSDKFGRKEVLILSGLLFIVASLAVWVTDWILNLIFPIFRESLGMAGIFFLFTVFLIPQFFFIWKVMPETKGKTLEEIEQSWLRKYKY
jgi:SP family arabinose:H+ symporter-like MFS transporter